MPSPTRRDLAALMRSTRRRFRTADGGERWSVVDLWRQVQMFRDNGPDATDPEVRAALERLTAAGAARTYWARATMYQAEAFDAPDGPAQGRELVQFYDALFNDGHPHLLQVYEQVRIADPARSQPSRPPQSRYPLPGDKTAFVADLTVPDHVIVPPNLPFAKAWRLYNAGTVAWTGRRLSRLGPATGYGTVRSRPSVPIPDTAPGDTVDITVEVVSPAVETTQCETRWKMTDADGAWCFPGLSYGVGMVLSVVDGAPIPDLTITNVEAVCAQKLRRLRESGLRQTRTS